jgi:hypothetical protein
MLGNTRGIQRLGTLEGIVLKSIAVDDILNAVVGKLCISFYFKKRFQFFYPPLEKVEPKIYKLKIYIYNTYNSFLINDRFGSTFLKGG